MKILVVAPRFLWPCYRPCTAFHPLPFNPHSPLSLALHLSQPALSTRPLHLSQHAPSSLYDHRCSRLSKLSRCRFYPMFIDPEQKCWMHKPPVHHTCNMIRFTCFRFGRTLVQWKCPYVVMKPLINCFWGFYKTVGTVSVFFQSFDSKVCFRRSFNKFFITL